MRKGCGACLTAGMPRNLRRSRTPLNVRFSFSATSRSVALPSNASSSFVHGNCRAERHPTAASIFRCGRNGGRAFTELAIGYLSLRVSPRRDWREQAETEVAGVPEGWNRRRDRFSELNFERHSHTFFHAPLLVAAASMHWNREGRHSGGIFCAEFGPDSIPMRLIILHTVGEVYKRFTMLERW